MDSNRQHATGRIAAAHFGLQSKLVFGGVLDERKQLVLPGEGLRIAVGLRYDGDEYQAPQLFAEGVIYFVMLKQSVVGIFIKVDGNVFFEGCFELTSKCAYTKRCWRGTSGSA